MFMTDIEIEAYVQSIEGNRAGDRSEKARVLASYLSSSILGSLAFDVPIGEAKDYFVGQKITIIIRNKDTTAP